MKHRFLAGFVLIFGLQGAALATPFTNGSFETPDASTASDRLTLTAGAFLTGSSGWQLTNFAAANSGSAIYSKANPAHGNDFVKPSDGNQFLTLNLTGGSNNTGGVQQVFDTVPGQNYTISFDFSAISNADNSVQKATWEIDSGATPATSAAGTILNSGTVSQNTAGFANLTMVLPYVTTNFSFTANSTSSTLRFVSLTSPPSHNAFGPVVDNVQVTPEPASLGMLAALAGLGLLRRVRRNNA